MLTGLTTIWYLSSDLVRVLTDNKMRLMQRVALKSTAESCVRNQKKQSEIQTVKRETRQAQESVMVLSGH